MERSTPVQYRLGFRHHLLAHCQKNQRPRDLESVPTSSPNRTPRLRTRNLALRVSGIEWTAAHATRPSLSDVKKF